MKKYLVLVVLWMPFVIHAQSTEKDSIRLENIFLDSVFIEEIENIPGGKPKVLHAEPLYIDLIRDLGARKGEKEWNYGLGMKADTEYDQYKALVEYEWAPVDRLGLEIELPLTFYGNSSGNSVPSNRIESLKLAAQWSLLVSEKHNTTLALGYIHEFVFTDLNKIGDENLYRGNLFNPFFVAAKRWGLNYHTLIYTGPLFSKPFGQNKTEHAYEINTNFHYMISGTRNFVGLEVNKELMHGRLTTFMRPQMRIGISENLLIGIVTGVPLNRENRGLSSFARIIYEPGFKSRH